MAKEIERKFLMKDLSVLDGVKGTFYRQGYLPSKNLTTMRIRVIEDSAYLTIKGANTGIVRAEYEYEIPVADANSMLDSLCEKPLIEKRRYRIQHEGLCWEVDEFYGDNEGLVIAEVELVSETQEINIPEWVGEEVSGDSRYYNSNLVENPYCCW